jgi:hypothetical protein
VVAASNAIGIHPLNREAFVETLLSETSSALKRAADDPEAIRGVVFLYLNRAYEAGLEPDLICDLLGVSKDCLLKRAKLSKQNEAAVIGAYEVLDRILERQYRAT